MESLKRNCYGIYRDITDEQLESYVSRKKAWFISADEAIKLKVADEIL